MPPDWTGRGRSVDVNTTHAFRFGRPVGATITTLPGRGVVPSGMPVGDNGPKLPPPAGTQAGLSAAFRSVPPPWLEKIGGISRDFSAEDYLVALPAGAGGVIIPATLRFQLPKDNVGWLQHVRIYVVAQLATTNIRWNFRINQGPISGFSALANTPGVLNVLVLEKNDLRVPVPMGALIDVTITNVDGAAVTVGAGFDGWYHPLAAELAYWGENVR